MRFALLSVSAISLFMAGSSAFAVGQADYEACQKMGDPKTAIPACTTITQDQSAPPADRAVAYFDRGVAYYSKNDLDHSIADWSEAIKLRPDYVHAYNNRGKAYRSKADYVAAVADYSEAIKLDPKHSVSYKGRGIANFFSGAMDKAREDFEQAVELDPTDTYALLWREIARRRIDNKMSSDLPQATTHLNMAAWPAPIVLLYAGQMTPHEVVVAAQNVDNRVSKSRMCDVGFYGGEYSLLEKDKDQAAQLFKNALDVCFNSSDEIAGATAELKAIDKKP